jgi:hypothetical protein
MLMVMREIMNSLLNSVLTFKTQLEAALSIPLADASELGEHEKAAVDGTVSWDAQRSAGRSFKCVDDRPGYLTGNGLGSLEIGAAHDD